MTHLFKVTKNTVTTTTVPDLSANDPGYPEKEAGMIPVTININASNGLNWKLVRIGLLIWFMNNWL